MSDKPRGSGAGGNRPFQSATNKITERVNSIVDDVKSFVVGDHHSESSSTANGTSSPGSVIRDPPVIRDLPVTLEELYRGATKRMKITKRIHQPDGTSRMEEKILQIDVKAGWKTGTKVTFAQEGDQIPGRIAADVVFRVAEKPHPKFQRENDDLITHFGLPIWEALCGTSIQVPMIDGNEKPLLITEVIKPGMTTRMSGDGMPNSKTGIRGDLVIVFEVRFPTRTNPQAKEILRDLFHT